MSNRLAGGIKAGATSVRIEFALSKSSDGTDLTGKVAAGLTASYWREGEAPTAIVLTDLALIDSVYSSGGVKEAAAPHGGSYRLDLPNAAVAAGADWVEVAVACTGAFTYKERIALEAQGAAEVFARLGAPQLASLSADLQALPAAVWANATRSLTTFGTLVSDIWTSVSRSLTDKLNFALSASEHTAVAADAAAGTAAIKGKTDLIGAGVAAPGDAMTLTPGERATSADVLLNRPMPGSPVAGTVARSLQLARGQRKGKWVQQGDNVLLYDVDQTTLLDTLTLEPAGGPYTSRTGTPE